VDYFLCIALWQEFLVVHCKQVPLDTQSGNDKERFRDYGRKVCVQQCNRHAVRIFKVRPICTQEELQLGFVCISKLLSASLLAFLAQDVPLECVVGDAVEGQQHEAGVPDQNFVLEDSVDQQRNKYD